MCVCKCETMQTKLIYYRLKGFLVYIRAEKKMLLLKKNASFANYYDLISVCYTFIIDCR